MADDKEKNAKLASQLRRFVKNYSNMIALAIIVVILLCAVMAVGISGLIVATDNQNINTCTTVSCNNPDICTTAACIDGECQILNAIPGCCADSVNNCEGVITGSYIFGTVLANNISRNTGSGVIIEQVSLSANNVTSGGYCNCQNVVTSSITFQNNIVNATSSSLNDYEQFTFTTAWNGDSGGLFFQNYNMSFVRVGTLVQVTMQLSPSANLTGITFLQSNSTYPIRYRPLYSSQIWPIRILNSGSLNFGLFVAMTNGVFQIYNSVNGSGTFGATQFSGFYASSFSWNVSP